MMALEYVMLMAHVFQFVYVNVILIARCKESNYEKVVKLFYMAGNFLRLKNTHDSRVTRLTNKLYSCVKV